MRSLSLLLFLLPLVRSQTLSEHPPVLQVTATEGYLAETADIGTTVRISPDAKSESLQILVNDEDLKPGMAPATYQYILTGLGATIFAVDQRGFVYLNVPNIDADPPNPSTYQLIVQAREVDTVPIRSSEPVTITIHIMDANDNVPQFEHSIYTVNTTASGGERPIVMVVASDADSGDYGNIKYRITQVTNDANDAFYYDEATNMLFATKELLPGQRYQVVIEATDGGGLSSRAIVIVLATGDSTVASVAPELPGMETFVPHPSWATTTSVPLMPRVTLGSAEEEETIQTFVTEVAENTPANTVVVTLGGEEVNHQVYYNLVGGNEEGKFNINSETGAVMTTEEFDRERTAMYSLQIETRSRAPDQHLYWTLIQVSVLDLNDNSPHFVGTQPIRLTKNIDDIDELTPNMVIGRVEVEDPDDGDNGRLELRVAPPMNRLFSVSSDGIISVHGDFTSNHFGDHRVFIVARDHGDPPRETRGEVIINVFGTLITESTASPTNEIYEYTSSIEEEPATQPHTSLYSITTAPSNQIYSSFPSPKPLERTPTDGGNDLGQTTVSVEKHEEHVIQEGDYSSPEASEEVTDRMTATATVPTTTTTTTTTSSPSTQAAPRIAPVFTPPVMAVHVEENRAEIEIARVLAVYPDGQPGPVSYVLSEGDASLFSVSSFSGTVTLLRPIDAETDRAFHLIITTAQSALLSNQEGAAHSVQITVHVDDVNDWIPAFETAQELLSVPEDTTPGTIVGQVHAFDQDRDEPNNKIRYRLVSAGGLEGHFAVNAENGIITLTRPLGEFAGEKITLKVEARDSGNPAQSSQTSVLVDVVPTSSSSLIPSGQFYGRKPSDGSLQFSLRNYTTSVAESMRPPHLVQVLSLNNKPVDTRFIMCKIVSGNFRDAFGVVAGTDGNCELRTQMELDRENTERYLLNISVSAGDQHDYALVSVTVLDVNDNVPRFVFDNDLGFNNYFGAVSSSAPAFTRILTVKAEDADLGNSSLVRYTIDPMSVQHKYFSISSSGEISTRQSMSQQQKTSRQTFFEFRVIACDSPISGQQLCTKAEVIVNVVSEAHRFKIQTSGLTPQQLAAHEKDLIKSIRQFTGSCTLLTVEKMMENSAFDSQARTDIYWFAVNPDTKRICKKHEFRKLFEPHSVQMIAGKVQPWFRLERIAEDTGENENERGNSLFSWQLTAGSQLLLVLGASIAVIALISIICAIYCFSKFKIKSQQIHTYHPGGFQQKLNTIYLPQPGMDPRLESYETQIMEMPISDEDLTIKSGSIGQPHQRAYRNYGRPSSAGYEGDFSIEESMYAVNGPPCRLDPMTKRISTLVIPAPDYPPTHPRGNTHKSLL